MASQTAPNETSATTTAAPTFKHYPSATTKFNIPLIANGNAYLGDIFSSSPLDPSIPLTSGLYRLAPGPALEYEYTYHEMKVILEGDFTIADMDSGKKVLAGVGDVFYFEKGVKVRFETEKGGLAFFTGGRKEGGA